MTTWVIGLAARFVGGQGPSVIFDGWPALWAAVAIGLLVVRSQTSTFVFALSVFLCVEACVFIALAIVVTGGEPV
jgi:hypothetical protein